MALPDPMYDRLGNTHVGGEHADAPMRTGVGGTSPERLFENALLQFWVNTFAKRSRLRTPVTAVIPFLANATRVASTVRRETFSCWAMAWLGRP
jgi:hypothetical protein